MQGKLEVIQVITSVFVVGRLQRPLVDLGRPLLGVAALVHVSAAATCIVEVFWVLKVRVKRQVQLPVVGVEAADGHALARLGQRHELAQALALVALQPVLISRSCYSYL